MSLLFSSFKNHCLKFGSNLMSVHNDNEYQLAKSLIRAYDPEDPPTWLGLSNCQKVKQPTLKQSCKTKYLLSKNTPQTTRTPLNYENILLLFNFYCHDKFWTLKLYIFKYQPIVLTTCDLKQRLFIEGYIPLFLFKTFQDL